MTDASERRDVVIAGGGGAGLALACAVSDALGPGLSITVADRTDFARPAAADVRASALSATSRNMLAALGVWPRIGAHAEPVRAIDITDSSLDDALRPVLVTYDNSIDGEPATWIVENQRLHEALTAAAAARPSLELVGSTAVESFAADEHGVTVSLAGGRTLRARLLVAADGRRSRLREAAGIKVIGWAYRQIGIVTTVRHEKPHGGRAVQHFLPAGPFAILPLTGNRSCITWSEDEARGREIMDMADDGFLAEAARRFGRRLGAIELAGPRAAWPLEMHLARTFVGDRLALVGDAAHGVHPIAGQGLNLGLRDAAALAEAIADAFRLGLDIGSATVLERYERWRRLDSALSAAAFDALNRLFSSDSAALRTARDFGLGLVERMPTLKAVFVAEAAGITGELPKLLRGERP